MTAALETPGLLSLAAGFTDNASLPCAAVREISSRLFGTSPVREALQYGTNQGRPGLRAAIARRVNQLDGAPVAKAEDVIVTNGSQQALYLAMQVIADPGDIILVDRPSYFVYLEMLKGLGLQAVTLPTGHDGALDFPAVQELLTELERTGSKAKVKALYFVSYFSNPSSRSLSLIEKQSLGQMLSSRGWCLPVLEDAAYRELYFGSPAEAPSVLAMPAWQGFPRLYLGTLTKPFATGLKVGYGVCSDADWLHRMLNVKGHHDFGTANYNQAVLEIALDEGLYEEQVSLLRKVYKGKSEALAAGLATLDLKARGWTWQNPVGGLYFWLRGPETLDTSFDGPLFARSQREGVIYVPGDLCFGDKLERNFLRLSFGVLEADALAEAASRLGKALIV